MSSQQGPPVVPFHWGRVALLKVTKMDNIKKGILIKFSPLEDLVKGEKITGAFRCIYRIVRAPAKRGPPNKGHPISPS